MDDAPTSVAFGGVGTGNVVVPVTVAPAGPDIDKITIKWAPSVVPASGPATCPPNTNNKLRPQATWNCGYALLRADLTLTGGPFNRASLIGKTLTGFFEPLNNNPGGAGQISYSGNTNQPNIDSANCAQNATYDGCTETVTNIPNGTRSLSLRLSSLYQTSNIDITALDNSGKRIPITGVQASIDSTGKAQDVLRRIQVRMPLIETGGQLPGASIQSNGSICKRFLIRSDYFAVDGGIIDPDLTNPMCDSSNVD